MPKTYETLNNTERAYVEDVVCDMQERARLFGVSMVRNDQALMDAVARCIEAPSRNPHLWSPDRFMTNAW